MLRLLLFCVIVSSCSSGSNEPSEARDASAPEARVQDARALDATQREPVPREDAAPADASELRADASDVSDGLAAAPREVCGRSWSIPARDDLSPDTAVPIAALLDVLVDDDGNLLVAGQLQRSFDFGTGALPVGSDVQMSTLLLKLDSACKLLWSRAYAPAAGYTIRAPIALGLDAQRNPMLITGSSGASGQGQLELVTLDANGAVLAEKAVPQRLGSGSTAWLSRGGDVLLTGPYQEPLDFGLGSLGAPRVNDRYNVLFRADGTPTRQALFSAPELSRVEQRVGPGGELVAWGHDAADYYGAPLGGPTLAKVDGTGKLAWKRELYPANPNNADDAEYDLGDDGTIALWTQHGDGASLLWEQTIREYAPDGTPRWDVPITLLKSTDTFSLHQLRLGKSTLAAYGAISGTARVGDVEVRSKTFLDGLLMQLDRGGAVRWSLTIDKPEVLGAIAITPRDEVVVVGYASATGKYDTPTFLRVYAHRQSVL